MQYQIKHIQATYILTILLAYNITHIIKSNDPVRFIHNKNTDQHAGDEHFRKHK